MISIGRAYDTYDSYAHERGDCLPCRRPCNSSMESLETSQISKQPLACSAATKRLLKYSCYATLVVLGLIALIGFLSDGSPSAAGDSSQVDSTDVASPATLLRVLQLNRHGKKHFLSVASALSTQPAQQSRL
jgi:hypothetical protein